MSLNKLILASERMDWTQPGATWAPCFHVCEDGYFCGRAHWWDGHKNALIHPYVSLADMLKGLIGGTITLTSDEARRLREAQLQLCALADFIDSKMGDVETSNQIKRILGKVADIKLE